MNEWRKVCPTHPLPLLAPSTTSRRIQRLDLGSDGIQLPLLQHRVPVYYSVSPIPYVDVPAFR